MEEVQDLLCANTEALGHELCVCKNLFCRDNLLNEI